MNEAKKRLDLYLEIHDELVEKCEDWISEFVAHRDVWNISIEVHNDAYPPYILATYTYETEGNCGRYERQNTEKIPLAVYWDDEAFEREWKRQQEANRAAIAKRQEEDARKARLAKAQRYEQYLDLCKEFENEED